MNFNDLIYNGKLLGGYGWQNDKVLNHLHALSSAEINKFAQHYHIKTTDNSF
jgi:hypothetical protein